ncbi:MAG: thioredoxin domain-containing protein [Oscillospiraceae bacterium]
MTDNRTPNRLIQESSPYLLQHAHNPVDWYPWGEAAFARARQENKPVFLSIGYSTCHWCHVMAHESFEDTGVAEILNREFIAVKVDREERPDVDNIYMRVSQMLTGSGGWPTSIFMSADGKPFYAGTYFPKDNFIDLLEGISGAWKRDRQALLQNGDSITAALREKAGKRYPAESAPIREAVAAFRSAFDPEWGGFGNAPKFPSPHNLMFLLGASPEMAEKTLLQMYRGGIFDHIGGGFSRYATDRFWLVPHFEKMLYDNALLAMAYLLAYEDTGKALYRTVAERIFAYLERDMHAPGGGFYSAQDADSEGVEGKFYLFTQDELKALLGNEAAEQFCRRYGITPAGNFEGGSIPNLLRSPGDDETSDKLIPRVLDYRSRRIPPHTDKKLLTAWNALTAAAYAMAGRILKNDGYLKTARETADFIARELTEGDAVYVGITDGRRAGKGFLDDYAFYLFALLQLHQATQADSYLSRAVLLTDKAVSLFWDTSDGGFFFSGAENENLVARPKESWDGAMPSGNSVMAYVLSRLSLLTGEVRFSAFSERQNHFMNGEAAAYPMGYAFYLWSVLPVKKVVCVLKDPADLKDIVIRSKWAFRVTDSPDYPLMNNKTTYYVCENETCLPPVNTL